MPLEAPGMLYNDAKVQYLCRIVHGEALHHFDSLSASLESENPLTMEAIILGFVAYLFTVNS